MSYNDIAAIAVNDSFRNRVTAAFAAEGRAYPEVDAQDNRWRIASAPGFGEKWAAAVAANNPNPGRDEEVITDGDILSIVQQVINSLPA